MEVHALPYSPTTKGKINISGIKITPLLHQF
jgi:hypothetical protein